jgi:hypothetical protein
MLMQCQLSQRCFSATSWKRVAFRGKTSHPCRSTWGRLGNRDRSFPDSGDPAVRIGVAWSGFNSWILVGDLSIAEHDAQLQLDEQRCSVVDRVRGSGISRGDSAGPDLLSFLFGHCPARRNHWHDHRANLLLSDGVVRTSDCLDVFASSLPDGKRASGLPGGKRASGLPDGERASGLPDGKRASGLPGGKRASGLPGGNYDSELPEPKCTSGLPGGTDDSGLPDGK